MSRTGKWGCLFLCLALLCSLLPQAALAAGETFTISIRFAPEDAGRIVGTAPKEYYESGSSAAVTVKPVDSAWQIQRIKINESEITAFDRTKDSYTI